MAFAKDANLSRDNLTAVILAAAIVSLAMQTPPAPTPGHPIVLPSEFHWNRFAIVPVTPTGVKLRFYTDTGGGMILASEVAEQLRLKVTKSEEGSFAEFPKFGHEHYIPPAEEGELYLMSKKETEQALGEGFDGMLGQRWFGGRVWTFDYPAKQLLWRAPTDLPPHSSDHEVKLHFQTNLKGERKTNFARIEASIDGEVLSFLLDTGAMDNLPDDVLKQVGDGGPANRATSFLTQSMFDKWRAKHADWKVISAKTKTGLAMIEVPNITIGGFEVGPVWFSVQRDRAFHEYMAQWMDKPTEGALGGSAFKYFRMTVDWPNAVAVFERPN